MRLSCRTHREGVGPNGLLNPEDDPVSDSLAVSEADVRPDVIDIPVGPPVEAVGLPRFDRPLAVSLREAKLLNDPPWARLLGRLTLEVSTQGWRLPTPLEPGAAQPVGNIARPEEGGPPAGAGDELFGELPDDSSGEAAARTRTRLHPPTDAVLFKDRLLYLLQPPLEDLFNGRQVQLPFPPYPYQMQGIAFLMPRWPSSYRKELK